MSQALSEVSCGAAGIAGTLHAGCPAKVGRCLACGFPKFRFRAVCRQPAFQADRCSNCLSLTTCMSQMGPFHGFRSVHFSREHPAQVEPPAPGCQAWGASFLRHYRGSAPQELAAARSLLPVRLVCCLVCCLIGIDRVSRHEVTMELAHAFQL